MKTASVPAIRVKTPPLGYVYAIRRMSDKMIKVGHTRFIARRMSALRRKHGEIKLLYSHGCVFYEGTEVYAHQILDHHRQGRTEWFKVTGKAAIEAIQRAAEAIIKDRGFIQIRTWRPRFKMRRRLNQ